MVRRGDGGKQALRLGRRTFRRTAGTGLILFLAAWAQETTYSGDIDDIRQAVKCFAVSNRLATHPHLSLVASTDPRAPQRLPLVPSAAAGDVYDLRVSFELVHETGYTVDEFLLRIEPREFPDCSLERAFRQGWKSCRSTERLRVDPGEFGDSILLRLMHRGSGQCVAQLEAELARREPAGDRMEGPGPLVFESQRPRFVVPLGIAATGNSRATLHFDLEEGSAFGPQCLRVCASPDWNITADESGLLRGVEGRWRTTVLRVSPRAFRIDTAEQDSELIRSVELCQVSETELRIREEIWVDGEFVSTARTSYRRGDPDAWQLFTSDPPEAAPRGGPSRARK